jgi:hypothetical protein
MQIWYNGDNKYNDTTPATARSRSNNDGIYFGASEDNSTSADLVDYSLVAWVDGEWTDQQIIEWSSDPFAMLRPRARALRIAAATQAATTTPVSASATAIGVASVTKQVGKIVGATADGVESVTVAEVYLLAAAATAVGVASVTLLFIAAPAAAPTADTTKAEPLLVNPGQWIKA